MRLPTNRNLLLILGVILIISLALLSKIGDLSHEIKSLSRNYRALQSEIGSLSGSIDPIRLAMVANRQIVSRGAPLRPAQYRLYTA